MARRNHDFQTIRSEGGLLPHDLLRRVVDPRAKLDGTQPEDYGFPKGERLNEVISQSWSRLRRHWTDFRAAAASLPGAEAATGLTNDKWSLPLLRELGYGLLPTSASPEIGGLTYAINRFLGPVPVHLVGCGLSLDRRAAGVRGAAAANPHGLVQDFLNRSAAHLWAVVSNGLRLRILRDSQALSRQAFLEFDLEAMFDGEVYSDFVLLWLVAHATRLNPRQANRPETCWLEQWTRLAQEQGTRALGDLREGVEQALQALGEGFASHPKNTALRDALRTGQLPLTDFHGQLLRVVYRLIFLFVAEDRMLDGQPLLHPKDEASAARTARERYAAHYSTGRLREMAGRIKGSRHGDLWQLFQILVGAVSGNPAFAAAREHLALPVLGSSLWDQWSTAALNDVELTNHDFLEALRHLAFTRQGKTLRPVDYQNLGAEELGGVYESLLALTPQISADGARFAFAEFGGSERKTSGSYYTPDSLVQCLLDSALDPVVEQAVKGKKGPDAEKAILGLRVCDPAVGSGHFLVGAAHRLARHLARVRALAQGESEPSPLLYQHALRDVIGSCLYGVDINPMAAELCRVGLWLEALEPGKPLSFLDYHIRVGNSLLGATPELIAAGLPDDAFNAIEGDDKKFCSGLKKRNSQEREGQHEMLHLLVAEPRAEYVSLEARTRSIDEAPDDTIAGIRRKKDQFHRLIGSPEYQHAQRVADTWCVAFVCEKQPDAPFEPITTDTLRRLEADPEALTPAQRVEVECLSQQYQFFHWRLAFPEVLAQGGFDCVLGNPPWEKIHLRDEEFFAQRSPEIAHARTKAERKRLIAALKSRDPNLLRLYEDEKQQHDRFSAFFRFSGCFPLTGVSRINLYSLFCETAIRLVSPKGRFGLVLASGILTDENNKELFESMIRGQQLVHAWDFENSEAIFPGVHRSYRFALVCGGGTSLGMKLADYAFCLTSLQQLKEEQKHFSLSASELELLNPNTKACPAFRSKDDASLGLQIYRRTPPVCRMQPSGRWPGVIRTPFNSANDSTAFSDFDKLCEAGGRFGEFRVAAAGGETWLPIYEPKFIHQFNHRFAGFSRSAASEDKSVEIPDEALMSPSSCIEARFWLRKTLLNERFPGRWFLLVRNIARSSDERTSIAAVIPERPCVDGNLLLDIDAPSALLLSANLNSFAYDYLARQKIAGVHFNQFIWKQLPLVLPQTALGFCGDALGSNKEWFPVRVLELTYTAWDLEPFARDCGLSGPPFRWDQERRFLLRCELDASFFHLYMPATVGGDWKPARVKDGAVREETEDELVALKRHFRNPRDAVAYIMDTFPIVRRRDEEKYSGDYRTKRVILEIYDAMQESIRTGQPYQTRLDPPPADPTCCHPPRTTRSAFELSVQTTGEGSGSAAGRCDSPQAVSGPSQEVRLSKTGVLPLPPSWIDSNCHPPRAGFKHHGYTLVITTEEDSQDWRGIKYAAGTAKVPLPGKWFGQAERVTVVAVGKNLEVTRVTE